MHRDTVRNTIIIIYMVGNALTFNALLKAERATMVAADNWMVPLLKILSLALVWPAYWLVRLLT
jgi:hypothetical protein